jgi:hypothetical protein
MKRATTLALVVTLALLGACSNEPQQSMSKSEPRPAVSSETLTPEQLGELGAEIRKDPARADEILARRGLNSQSFEKAIRDVTESPDASKRYAESYRKASA